MPVPVPAGTPQVRPRTNQPTRKTQLQRATGGWGVRRGGWRERRTVYCMRTAYRLYDTVMAKMQSLNRDHFERWTVCITRALPPRYATPFWAELHSRAVRVALPTIFFAQFHSRPVVVVLFANNK